MGYFYAVCDDGYIFLIFDVVDDINCGGSRIDEYGISAGDIGCRKPADAVFDLVIFDVAFIVGDEAGIFTRLFFPLR